MKFPWLRADGGEPRRGCLNPQQVTGFAPCTHLVLPGAGAAPLWALVRGMNLLVWLMAMAAGVVASASPAEVSKGTKLVGP